MSCGCRYPIQFWSAWHAHKLQSWQEPRVSRSLAKCSLLRVRWYKARRSARRWADTAQPWTCWKRWANRQQRLPLRFHAVDHIEINRSIRKIDLAAVSLDWRGFYKFITAFPYLCSSISEHVTRSFFNTLHKKDWTPSPNSCITIEDTERNLVGQI